MPQSQPFASPHLGPILGRGISNSFYDTMIGTSISETADAAVWYSVPSGSGTAVIDDDETGGALLLTTQANSGSHELLKLNGEPWVPAASVTHYFHTRLQTTDADQAKWLIGLIDDSTTDPLGDASLDGIAFLVDAQDGNIDCVVGNGTNETQVDSGIDVADDTDIDLDFVVIEATKVRFYVNGALVTTIATYIPTDNQTLGMQVESTGNAEDIKVAQVGLVVV